MIISLDMQVSQSPEVYFQTIDNEAVLLDMKNGKYFGLDGTGTRIWQLINEYKSLQLVYNTMLQEYDVEPQRLEKDLLTLVENFLERGLISVNPD